jgi:hypothetical protein
MLSLFVLTLNLGHLCKHISASDWDRELGHVPDCQNVCTVAVFTGAMKWVEVMMQ